MRFSHLVGRTERTTAADITDEAHQLIIRTGIARPMLAGGMCLLPVGMRVLRQLEKIMHAALVNINAQEFRTPIVQAAQLWEQTGRYVQYGAHMLRATNRADQALVLAPTHEEAITALAAREIDSYRQLPALMYQIHTKYRDEERARGGLLRLREFTMLDAYSFAADEGQLDAQYQAVAQAFASIFEQVGVEYVAVEAANGDMGGSSSREYMALTAHGEDRLVMCEHCGYAANSEVAVAQATATWQGEAAPREKVATPACRSIAELAAYLGISADQTAKAVFFKTPEHGLVFVVIRGDLEVSESKVQTVLGASHLEPATVEDIATVGAVAGYASPVGIQTTVLADRSVVQAGPLVAGANAEGYHYVNVVYGRDWQATLEADIQQVHVGAACVNCGSELVIKQGVEIGHIFKLGSRYSEPLQATFVDNEGSIKPILMGCYGIGLERLLHIVVDQHHDHQGCIWPQSVAPWQVQLVQLGTKPEITAAAEDLYTQLQAYGIAVLYDDRTESAGVKFNDADLLGLPWRIVVSQRGLKQGTWECQQRSTGEPQQLDSAALERWVATLHKE